MNINSLFVKSVRINYRIINYQTLRWRRSKKPFWLGLAKSKMFVIPEPREILTPEEKKEHESLKRLYQTRLKSILNFIQNGNPKLEKIIGAETTEMGKNKVNCMLQNQITESFKINEKWNIECKKLREIRMKEKEEKELEEIIQKIDIEKTNKGQHMEIIEKIVREEKLLSENFITPENLDESIENCLDKIECYDFAIDLEGNKYLGRESLQTQPSNDKRKINKENVV